MVIERYLRGSRTRAKRIISSKKLTMTTELIEAVEQYQADMLHPRLKRSYGFWPGQVAEVDYPAPSPTSKRLGTTGAATMDLGLTRLGKCPDLGRRVRVGDPI